MHCPVCFSIKTSVSRTLRAGSVVVRMRDCECGANWQSEEKIVKRSVQSAKPGDGFGRISIAPAIKAFVTQRDGDVCRYCGGPAKGGIDHVVPLAARVPLGIARDEELARRTSAENLASCCLPCNLRKGSEHDGRQQKRFYDRPKRHLAATGGTNSAPVAPAKATRTNEIADLDVGSSDSLARGEGLGGVSQSGLLFPISASGPSQPSDPDRPERKPKRSTARATGETDAFLAFWAEQLRKVAKVNALKAWHKQGCEEIAPAVLAGWRAQLPTMRARELEKVPHPASWLNGRRWQDVLEVPQGQGAKGAAPSSPYCAWHRDGAKSRIASRFPDPACPDCKTHAARAAARSSEPAGFEMPKWMEPSHG
ncbi:MAG: HNH endonuclease [Hyalangium sp.]|jgi:5-methylcytosine-specific restriction endonuclease McrA|uniref:HNH endonuclease n=1 Tax=Hyalangium sp. TaxID=2028555 RepID=UPI003899F6FD